MGCGSQGHRIPVLHRLLNIILIVQVCNAILIGSFWVVIPKGTGSPSYHRLFNIILIVQVCNPILMGRLWVMIPGSTIIYSCY